MAALLAAGADPDAAAAGGATPLYEAASRGHTAVVQALLRAGADREPVKQVCVGVVCVCVCLVCVCVCVCVLCVGVGVGWWADGLAQRWMGEGG